MSRLRSTLLLPLAAFAVWLATACSSADPVIPTINTPPVAQAGGPYAGVVGQSTQFDGGGSADQEGPIASYAWTVEDGGPTELAGIAPLYRCTAAGTFTLTLTVRDSNGAQDSDTGSIACVIMNDPPTADAGGPYVSRLGQAATLDGSGSADSDGAIVSWQWTVEDGTPTVLDGETVEYGCTTRGEFVVRLSVTDDGGDTGTASTTLECVENVPPTAVTGGPFSVRIGARAFLDARGSSDPDGSIVSYRWVIDDGGPTVFNTSTAFYRCTSAQTLDVTLTVTDAEGATGSETTTLDCVANVQPVADPGGPYSVDLGTSVTLDGTGSEDPDGSIQSWVWSIADPGSPTVLNGESVSYLCDAPGTFPVTLTVADNEGATSTGVTSVTCVPNQAPTADAGGPYDFRVGRPGTLDGSGSRDDDGEIVSYAWALDGGPTFSTDAVTSYTCGTSGKFDVTLTVTDDDGASASATTSLDCVANVAPVADPGGPYEAVVGETVLLDGGDSEDPDGDVVDWDWTITPVDGGTPTVLTGETATFRCPAVEIYEVLLAVRDNDGAGDQDATTLACLAANTDPTVSFSQALYVGTIGDEVPVSASAFDPDPGDGITAIDFDLNGDGAYEIIGTVIDGSAQTTFTCSTAGTFDIGVQATDQNSGRGLADAQVRCDEPANTDPTVSFSQALYVGTIGDEVPVSASAFDPDPGDGITAIDFDLDGDGAYEIIGIVIDGSAQTTFTCSTAGTFDIGVQATDQNSGRGLADAQVRCDEPTAPSSDVSGSFPGPTSGGLRDRIGTVAEPATR